MKDCCNHTSKDKQCLRSSDQKIFTLPRKFSKERCRKAKGFTMKSSCAPYKGCYTKKRKTKKRKTKKRRTKKLRTKKRRTKTLRTKKRKTKKRKTKKRTRKQYQRGSALPQTPQTPVKNTPTIAELDDRIEGIERRLQQSTEPRYWEQLMPALSDKVVNPLHCIGAQWLVLKTALSENLERDLNDTIQDIESKLNAYLGVNGIEQHIVRDDFYTKWAVGGLGHASAVVLSDLIGFLPGAGTVGMVHQLTTDKLGPVVAKSKWYQSVKNKFKNKIKTYQGLLIELSRIRSRWLSKLPREQIKYYENTYFLEYNIKQFVTQQTLETRPK